MAGIVFLLLGSATLVAAAVSTTGDWLAMTCSDDRGCQTEHPVLVAVVGLGYRISMPLLVAGVAFIAGAQTITALGSSQSIGSDTMKPQERESATQDAAVQESSVQESPVDRRIVAIRLWILASVLVVGSTVLGIWSASPAGVEATMVSGVDRSSLGYIANQLSYILVPAGALSGFLVAGLALIVTRARPSARRARPEAEARDPVIWDGKDHEPFRRPSDLNAASAGEGTSSPRGPNA